MQIYYETIDGNSSINNYPMIKNSDGIWVAEMRDLGIPKNHLIKELFELVQK